MTEIKLKPCPFCGGMSAMFTRVGDAGGRVEHRIRVRMDQEDRPAEGTVRWAKTA